MGDQPVRKLLHDQKVNVSLRSLNADLTCRVCLGIIRNCTTVMECLHRFCGECIEKSLRLGRKQCPSCRVACPSRRNLRRDIHFDALIAKIFPDIAEAEAEQDSLVQQIITGHNHKAFVQGIQAAASKQKEKQKLRAKRPKRLNAEPEGSEKTKKIKPPDSGSRDQGCISFCLQEHPSITKSGKYRLKKRYLRTSRTATVRLLSKYLSQKLATPPGSRFSLEVSTDNRSEPLAEHLTLEQIEDTLWNRPEGLILTYTLGTSGGAKGHSGPLALYQRPTQPLPLVSYLDVDP